MESEWKSCIRVCRLSRVVSAGVLESGRRLQRRVGWHFVLTSVTFSASSSSITAMFLLEGAPRPSLKRHKASRWPFQLQQSTVTVLPFKEIVKVLKKTRSGDYTGHKYNKINDHNNCTDIGLSCKRYRIQVINGTEHY